MFVETFPDAHRRWQVTPAGGLEPMWRADGRELFFLSPAGEILSIDVQRVDGAVRFGQPRVLFEVPHLLSGVRRYAPFPDGRRFIALTRVPRATPQKITVVMNWRSRLPD